MIILSVTEAAIELIRKKIILGEFAPGEKLIEMKLSSDFNISRPPLREAFRVLQQEGQIISVPRKGIYVRELSIKEITDIFQFRQLIELDALRHLEQANIRKIPEMEKLLVEIKESRFQNSLTPENIYRSQKLSLNFHKTLVDTLNNSYISRNITTLIRNLSRYIYIYFSDAKNSNQAHNDHEKIFESIKNGDYQTARKQLTAHLEVSSKNISTIVGHILKKPKPSLTK
ncbi:MAG: GntR family transcriptional regulator [Desulfobacterales bacterium]|nr:GntR family transcriptional regulator [Desulfobacterales bacterium]MDD4072105.1 GntR family transcriptional regulator [Desulfobacterales bacterium]MDD4392741.1 GntR family transcriptional regulator [Desulfobacterales bacterium]